MTVRHPMSQLLLGRVARIMIVLLGSCAEGRTLKTSESGSPSSSDGSTLVMFDVRYASGSSGTAQVSYTRPDGKEVTEIVRIPWASSRLSFNEGSTLKLRAQADFRRATALQCSILVGGRSGKRHAETSFMEGRAHRCKVEARV